MGKQPPMPQPDGGRWGPDRSWSVPGLGISFLARRARSSWLLLACVAVTVLLATGLAAAAWTFAAAQRHRVPRRAVPAVDDGRASVRARTARARQARDGGHVRHRRVAGIPARRPGDSRGRGALR